GWSPSCRRTPPCGPSTSCAPMAWPPRRSGRSFRARERSPSFDDSQLMGKVLIVDDEPDVLLLLRVNLEAAGYQTVLAADGETALIKIDESDPDVVLLDIMMPVMDGWGVLRALSERDNAPRVVVVSAKSSDR